MNSEKLTEISKQRSNSFSVSSEKQDFSINENNTLLEDIVKKQISIVNDLKGKIEEKNKENRELVSQNEILSKQLMESRKIEESSYKSQNEDQELLRNFMECLKQLNLQTSKTETGEEKNETHKTYEIVNNRLFFFKKIANSDVYERISTPTTVDAVANNWFDISEIHYANDISYNELDNPKVSFYRNKNNSCYIILKIKDTIYDVFYGVNGRNIEIGSNSFSVYEVSKDIGSFTDNISRLIYEDISGLYFVSSVENSVERIIDTYQKEGEFKFKGSIIKVSIFDGNITLNNKKITEDNFFDNWTQKECEIEIVKSNRDRNMIIEKVKNIRNVPSTNQPKEREILRNFYPPEGYYKNIYISNDKNNIYNYSYWLTTYDILIKNNIESRKINEQSKNWLDMFISKRLSVTKEMSSQECKKLIEDGIFSTMLKYYPYN